MRKRCLNTIYDIAKENPEVVFIGSDLGKGTLEEFKNEMPDRFFMEGIAEQHVVGMAAGLAMEGKIVYVNTIATFLTRRCFEQNVVDVGMGNLNVRFIGNGGGLVYAPLGPTHLAFEDIAIMSAIPNMSIIVCADAEQMENAVRETVHHQGPIYFRLAKGHDPVVTKPEDKFELGKGIIYKDFGEVTLFATGVMLDRAFKVAKHYESKNLKVGVIDIHTVKPFDTNLVLEAMEKSKIILSLEEHSTIGGMGSTISDIISQNCYDKNLLYKKMALPDVFSPKYGSQNEQISYFKLDVDHIISEVDGLLSKIY